MNNVYYFAYGSNLLIKRLINRVGDVKIKGSYKLYGYKLSFNAVGFSYISYANIIPATKNDYVEGVLYELTPDQFDMLDRYEGLYERQYFIINSINAIGCTYVAKRINTQEHVPSDKDYIDTIMEGAKDFGLHKAYTDAAAQLSNTTTKVKGKIKSVKKSGRTTFSVARGFHW